MFSPQVEIKLILNAMLFPIPSGPQGPIFIWELIPKLTPNVLGKTSEETNRYCDESNAVVSIDICSMHS